MNSIGNKRKGGRNAGGNRGGRMRGMEKSIVNEGAYGNCRLVHAVTAIVGCEVQVQVRNKGTYEGVFKTFSPQLEVVLDLAHKIDETPGAQNSMPTKDRLIDTVIFNLNDIVMISAIDVDLDFASKDAFTDTAISGARSNGKSVNEKVLTPWEGDPEDGGLDSLDTTTENANGWDPNEMFRTNAEQFNVKSSYDPSLKQYTTPLKQENTKEYKEREAQAARLAQEIERSEGYKKRAELENGDGDEEDKYSAVVRPGEAGKYVPPHMRSNPAQGRVSTRSSSQSSTGGKSRDSQSPGAQGSLPQTPTTPTMEEPKLNGDGESPVEAESSSPKPAQVSAAVVSAQAELTEAKETSPSFNTNKVDRKSSNPKAQRDAQLQELKEFGINFKLSDEKDRKQQQNQQKVEQQQQAPQQQLTQPLQAPVVQAQIPLTSHQQGQVAPQQTAVVEVPNEEKEPEEKPQEQEKAAYEETLKKSALNPLAKEFTLNPNAKPFTPKQQPMPTVRTPPRPQTQSPVVVPQMPGMPHQATLYPPFVVPVSMAQPMANSQQPRFTKRAIVSVQPRTDYNAAAQAAAATGPPLLAQAGMPQGQQSYMLQYTHTQPSMGGPGGTPVPQVRNLPPYAQMVPLSAMSVSAPRMMAPHGQPQQVHTGQEQQQPPQPQQGQTPVFMTPAGPGTQPVPAHLAHHHGAAQGHTHPTPAHVTPHHQPTPPLSQPSHMNQSAGGHPAPSPVQHGPPQGQGQQPGHPPGQPGHPPNSATPQPHQLLYQHGSQISQPPLQPSPHTPTSPQSMYPPPMSFAPAGAYSYTTQAGMQAITQMTYAHTPSQTTVTHSQHQQHQQHQQVPQQPHLVMVQPQGQMQPGPQQVHQHPIHTHHMQGPMPGQAGPPMMPQQTAMNVSSATNVPHPQMHYVHHPQQRFASQAFPAVLEP